MPNIFALRSHNVSLHWKPGVRRIDFFRDLNEFLVKEVQAHFSCEECKIIEPEWFNIVHMGRDECDFCSVNFLLMIELDAYPNRYELVEPGKEKLKANLEEFLSHHLNSGPTADVQVSLLKRAQEWTALGKAIAHQRCVPSLA